MNDVAQIAMLNGLTAGSVDVAIAAALGLSGYGLSLVLFVIALRYLGTARTGEQPHAYTHTHAPLRQAHPHYADEHHRHEH